MHPLEIIILLLIQIGLIIHYYLDVFFDLKRLPFPSAFSLFVNIFLLVYAVNFIWMFGIWFGLLLTILCYFSIAHSAVLWMFLIPLSLEMKRSPETVKLNPLIHWCHSKVILLAGILGVINIFTSPYASVLKQFDNYTEPLLALAIFIIAGNILRITTMAVLKLK